MCYVFICISCVGCHNPSMDGRLAGLWSAEIMSSKIEHIFMLFIYFYRRMKSRQTQISLLTCYSLWCLIRDRKKKRISQHILVDKIRIFINEVNIINIYHVFMFEFCVFLVLAQSSRHCFINESAWMNSIMRNGVDVCVCVCPLRNTVPNIYEWKLNKTASLVNVSWLLSVNIFAQFAQNVRSGDRS